MRPIPLRVRAVLLAGVLLAGCDQGASPEPEPAPVARDLPAIEERGELTMLTMTNATSYFLYRGEVMGFEYELLRAFARDRDLTLKVEVVEDRNELVQRLLQGEGDVIASQITASGVLAERVACTTPLYRSRPSVVQAKEPPRAADLAAPVEDLLAADADGLESDLEVPVRLVRKPAQLAGRKVHVPGHTAVFERLAELEDRITGDIHIVELGGAVSYERLIRRVADGDVRLAAAPEVIARLDEAYFTNIAVRPTFGPPVEVVWGVRPNAPRLLEALDAWLAEHRDDADWNELEYKYFVDRRGYRERRRSDYLTSETSRLSEFDPLFEEHAGRLGWDWRLLASQAYQESKFDPRARSWAGAKGLLQLMPRTARARGVRDPFDPNDNIRGAVAQLEWLTGYWKDKIADPEERRRFILASYNAGQGHVQDARRLAEKNGDDPDSWDDVSYWLLQKSKREVYTDPVVRHGFARGLEPVTYVAYVMERYEHYRRFVDA